MAATGSAAPSISNRSTEGLNDPFTSNPDDGEVSRRTSHRYSAFDTQLFSQYGTTSSPSQAKKALEAHLAETDKRLEEASKLGTALVQQRKDLSDRLKDVESKQGDQEIGPELRQKLVEIEKEYNELGRDSARAFLAPKREGTGSVLTEIRNPASPTKFSTQATDSPSKVSVPSRKQRNQPASRVHDIEFATEISTSLLAQVRQLQGVLAERDESLKKLAQEKSHVEVEHQGLSQRIRNMDESEQRYKDENWSLETQTHELMAANKEAAAREQKLQQTLSLATNEKSAAQRELDDIKQAHGNLSDEYITFRKAHDADVAGLKRSATQADTDRGAMQRRIEELTSQNQELAKAVASRFKGEESEPVGDTSLSSDDFALDHTDGEHSPPPSPSKGGAKNSALESETLRSSLTHAHRMIQTLKTNIHKEKSEKLDLKRLLQESRDELEIRRVEAGASSKRAKTKSQTDISKRTPKVGQLGAGRGSRTEVEMQDADWEDHEDGAKPKRVPVLADELDQKPSDTSDAYQTANETDAFETANEKDTTESEAFQTGAESLGGDSSDQLTETEGTPSKEPARATRPAALPVADKRSSYISTASITDADSDHEAKTPVQSTFSNLKHRFRLSRGSRRSLVGNKSIDGTPGSFRDSPASTHSSRMPKGQSLAAELGGDFDDEYEDDDMGTPSRRTLSRRSTPARGFAAQLNEPPVPKIPTVDAGIMTEPWEAIVAAIAATAAAPAAPAAAEALATPAQTADSGVQGTPTDTATPEPVNFEFSTIQAVENEPVAEDELKSPATVVDAPSSMDSDLSKEASAGMIGSVLGWAIGKRQSTPQPITEDATEPESAKNAPFTELSPNVQRAPVDSGAQTILSAEQIDSLMSKQPTVTPIITNGAPIRDTAGPKPVLVREVAPQGRTRRPGSSSSVRASTADAPPLPSDHRQAIMAASQSGATRGSIEMGPPVLPASAYRSAGKRPQTPSDQATPRATAAPNTPRQSGPRLANAARSTRSRRSSVSSFESELDARFNIRPDGTPATAPMDGGTDPRMIQAITQTMIGEFLWKYTRRTGRGDMSGKRHRRFFWVHPYTRTLYWSDTDPSNAGRAQLKAKSVAIEAVRVVVDDNPMPPGLHRKSLIIVTPGRSIKFTATTGQRHETWFNALSYLLLRSGPEPQSAVTYNAAGGDLTADDVAEFNPGAAAAAPYVPRHSTASRTSLSTYNSRTNTTRNSRVSSRNQSPSRSSVRRVPPQQLNQGSATSRTSQANTGSFGSRLSSYLRPGRTTSAAVKEGEGSGIYDARVVNDSAEDVRAVLAKQDEEADQLENVRACCDGKHDVGSLNHRSGHRMSGRHSHSHAH